MNHMEQVATEAELAAYIMASPDANEIEFLNLKPMASDSDRENLAARWHGRGLKGVGVIGRLPNGRIRVALKVPFDHLQLAAFLLAFTRRCEALNAGEPLCVNDSVEWLERLHRLEDPRSEL